MNSVWVSAKNIFWKFARFTKTEETVSSIYRFLLDYLVYKKKSVWFNVEAVGQYCTENYETVIEIEPRQNRTVYEPSFFELSNGREYQFPTSPIYVAYMHDVMALGATGLVLTGGTALSDAMRYDEEHRIDFRYGPIMKAESSRVQVKIRSEIKEIDRAVNLCGLAAFNYYHFTMEILSRLGYVNSLPDVADMPILVDEEIKVYPQLEELLHIVNPNREVIYVPTAACIKVHFLIQPSMNTWMPINIKGEKKFRMADNLIAKSGVMNIRSCVSRYMKGQTERKIYISRKNCHAIRLVNEDEIIPLFEEAGFDIVYAEAMNYIEQVELFSTVKCVVAPTGAALTNVIYCHPETVVGCIIPKEYNFCIYSTLTKYVGGKTMFLNPEIVSRGRTMGEDCYQVEQRMCRRYIAKLIEMCD